jgi:hypothetical protein
MREEILETTSGVIRFLHASRRFIAIVYLPAKEIFKSARDLRRSGYLAISKPGKWTKVQLIGG